MLHESAESSKVSLSEKNHNKGDLSLATEVLKGFDRIPVALKATVTEWKGRRTHRQEIS